MIYLLGGSGYVGQAYQALLKSKGVSFKNLQHAELDYTDVATLTATIRADRPAFLINAAGYTGKPNVDACELDKTNCLFGNAILLGRIAEACEADAPNFTFRQNNCSFYSGTKALGEEILAGRPNVFIWRLRIPFDHRESPRN
jgi:hypothetical protein